jgi:hypothetical protein
MRTGHPCIHVGQHSRISRVLGWIDTLLLGDFSCFAKTRVDKPRVIEDVDRRTVMTTKLFDSSVIR